MAFYKETGCFKIKRIKYLDKQDFFLDLEISTELISLQNSIIDSVDSLRASQFGSADPQKLIGLNDKEQASMDRYSYPFAGPALRPHFTVGRIETPGSRDQLEIWIKQNPIPNEFHFEKFVLFEVGMYGRLESIRFQTV